ncbi:serine/threonine-protein kinase [Aquisphaera insulae]|uniref:serine/threonine-protein kinase n=1 Tax=Aquisphaera insulae TaxID=2712864 RepID=UPI0013EC7935|nr:serine/threonine-protein kinase [Aquisphaera insulae]
MRDDHTAASPAGDVADGAGASAGQADLDPALGDLFEELTERIQAGESVDPEAVAAEHPELAGPIRQLLPSLLSVAMTGRAINDAFLPGQPGPDGTRRFGEFTIDREVGRGGMGVVYEARQSPIGRRVALKVLTPAAALDPQALKRFQLEAQVAGLLRHPGIVPVYAVGTVGGIPYYAMQFIEGRSLAELLSEIRDLPGGPVRADGSGPPKTPGPLASGLLAGSFPQAGREPAREPSPALPGLAAIRSPAYIRTAARLAAEAAGALAYAHEQGVVHRDVKPANLLLDDDGHLWVADFGMADVQGDAGLTLTGDLPGTLRYMSPEQALGKRSLVDRRTDIYALGATLHELLTLRPAVAGEDKQEILHRIAEEEPAPVRRLNPAVPVDLATIVAKCLSKDPSARYETARHLADDLVRLLDGRPIAARPVGPPVRLWRWSRRKPALAGLAASLAITAIAGLVGIAWNWREAMVQRQESRRQAARAEAINRFLVDKLLSQAEPETNPDVKKVTLLEVLDRASAEVGDSLYGQPETEAHIRMAIGKAYHGLVEYARSEEHYRAAVALLGNETNTREAIEARIERSHLLGHLDRNAEAETILRAALASCRERFEPDEEVTLNTLEYLGAVCGALGKLEEAESLERELLARRSRAAKPDQKKILTAMNNLGVTLVRRGKLREAEPLFRETERIERDTLPDDHLTLLTTRCNLGFVAAGLGRLEEAERLIRGSVERGRASLGGDNLWTLYWSSKLGEILTARGRLDEAERLLRPTLEAQRLKLGDQHVQTRETAGRLDALGATRVMAR